MKEIPLNHGFVTLVDDEDYAFLMKWKWHAKKSKMRYSENWYAVRGGGVALNNRYVHMHKVIMKTECLVDHRNRNGLDNRKANLRIATSSQNSKNKKGWGKSKYLGVSLNITKRKTKKPYEKWVATIMVNGKNKTLGRFDCEEDAARKYDEFAKNIHGDFANLNFK